MTIIKGCMKFYYEVVNLQQKFYTASEQKRFDTNMALKREKIWFYRLKK